jgi:site-specific DNA-methyltransferase (adenine-specific)
VSDLHPEIQAVLDGTRRWALVHGDCREVLAGLPPKSVDHVITDPPYSEHVHSKSWAGSRKVALRDGNGRLTRCAFARAKGLEFEHLTPELRAGAAELFGRVTKRWVMCFSDLEGTFEWFRDLVDAKLEFVRTMTWVKEGAAPQYSGDRPGTGAEAICLVHPKGKKRWHGGGKLGVFTYPVERLQYGEHDERINTTQKPMKLMVDLVESFTDPDDIVLDAFAGGATTGIACLRLGRRFIGCELRPEQYETARQRLEAEDEGLLLKDVRAGQTSLFAALPEGR